MTRVSDLLLFGGGVLVLCAVAGCQFQNNPPDTPATPIGPTQVTYSTYASYVSSATDPDGDSVYLGFSADSSTYPNSYGYPNWSRLVGSGDTARVRLSLYYPGTYQVRVRALDQHGDSSDWSPSLSVTVLAPMTACKTSPNRIPTTRRSRNE